VRAACTRPMAGRAHQSELGRSRRAGRGPRRASAPGVARVGLRQGGRAGPNGAVASEEGKKRGWRGRGGRRDSPRGGEGGTGSGVPSSVRVEEGDELREGERDVRGGRREREGGGLGGGADEWAPQGGGGGGA
jgi:hypothetical protein